MFGALLYMAQRPAHQDYWNGIICRALKCGAGGKWRREKTNEPVIDSNYRRDEDTSK